MGEQITAATIKAADGSSVKVEYRESLESASKTAKAYAEAGYPDRYIVITEKQTAGPSSLQKHGEDATKGIFISVILRPSVFPSQASFMGHLSAVALATALEEHTTKTIGLGWVSDVYCDGERIGYCTLEGKLNSYGAYDYLIVNLAARLDGKNFPPRLTDMVRKVFESQNHSIPMLIGKTVINKFFAAYSSIRSPGKYMDAYKRKFLLYGKKIKYIVKDQKKICKVADVSKETGSLIIENRKKEKIEIKSPSLVIMPKRIKD